MYGPGCRKGAFLRAVAQRRRSSVWRRPTGCARTTASRAGSSPAKPSRRRSRRRAASRRRACISRSTTSARASGRSKEADAATREYVRLLDVIVASGHRAEHLAQADAARRRRRSRDVRRQPAPHPRAGRPPRLLRAHRHGELAVDAADARCLRDAVAAGVSQHRHRAAGGAVPHRAGRAPHE